MPTIDWLNCDAVFRLDDQVPYRLLQPVSLHGDGNAHNLLLDMRRRGEMESAGNATKAARWESRV